MMETLLAIIVGFVGVVLCAAVALDIALDAMEKSERAQNQDD